MFSPWGLLQKRQTDGWADRRTDRWTDRKGSESTQASLQIMEAFPLRDKTKYTAD